MDNNEVIVLLSNVYEEFVEGDRWIDYCNDYSDGYIDALYHNSLITRTQADELHRWNNEEKERWIEKIDK